MRSKKYTAQLTQGAGLIDETLILLSIFQEGLEQLKAALADVGVDFEYTFSDGIRARYIMTDTGWNISLDRVLHIYQPVAKNYYLMGYYDLDLRPCKETKIIYTKVR